MTKSSASTAILLVAPFAYPPAPHIRRNGPTGYVDYVSFKPWLRDEFIFRCVYCLSRETWYPNGVAGFSVDHVEPQVLRPDLVTVYINLVYACNRCNSIKREVTLLPDPTKIALGDLLSVDEQGRISGRTSDGRRMIDILHLDSDASTRVRAERLMVLQAKQRHPDDPIIDRIFRCCFGFPADMEDLRGKHPPGKNSIGGSEKDCYYARNERGELPAVY